MMEGLIKNNMTILTDIIIFKDLLDEMLGYNPYQVYFKSNKAERIYNACIQKGKYRIAGNIIEKYGKTQDKPSDLAMAMLISLNAAKIY